MATEQRQRASSNRPKVQQALTAPEEAIIPFKPLTQPGMQNYPPRAFKPLPKPEAIKAMNSPTI